MFSQFPSCTEQPSTSALVCKHLTKDQKGRKALMQLLMAEVQSSREGCAWRRKWRQKIMEGCSIGTKLLNGRSIRSRGTIRKSNSVYWIIKKIIKKHLRVSFRFFFNRHCLFLLKIHTASLFPRGTEVNMDAVILLHLVFPFVLLTAGEHL